MCGTRVHISTKLGDDWLNTATCISQNVTISFKHEYRKQTLTSRCDVISDTINIKNTFWGIIYHDLSISDVKMNLSRIKKIKMAISRSGRVLHRKLYQNLGHTTRQAILFPTFWGFDWRCSSNINEVIAISKFQLLLTLVTYLFDLWPWNTTTFCTASRYICGWKIVKICQSHRDLCVKMCWFHLNMNIEGWFCRHDVTSLVRSAAWNTFSWIICIQLFHTRCQLEATFGNF